MQEVSILDFALHVRQYLADVPQGDVTLSVDGEPFLKIIGNPLVSEDKTLERQSPSLSRQLFGIAANTGLSLDEIRNERLKKYEGVN
jgi:hypothetical protein